MNLKSLRMLLAVGLVAVAGHGWATVSLPEHETTKWQDISSITWSTDGTNWGNSALVVGQSVEFKVAMHKTNIGNHYGDFVKVWIDWDHSETFDNNTSEVLLADYKVANATAQPQKATERLDGGTYDFFSGPIAVTNLMIGTYDLLARVTCSESLLASAGLGGNWNNQWNYAYTKDDNAWYKNNFSSTLKYHQGQAGLTTLTVNGVPEPGTLALLVVAMVGMGLRRKQANRV